MSYNNQILISLLITFSNFIIVTAILILIFSFMLVIRFMRVFLLGLEAKEEAAFGFLVRGSSLFCGLGLRKTSKNLGILRIHMLPSLKLLFLLAVSEQCKQFEHLFQFQNNL